MARRVASFRDSIPVMGISRVGLTDEIIVDIIQYHDAKMAFAEKRLKARGYSSKRLRQMKPEAILGLITTEDYTEYSAMVAKLDVDLDAKYNARQSAPAHAPVIITTNPVIVKPTVEAVRQKKKAKRDAKKDAKKAAKLRAAREQPRPPPPSPQVAPVKAPSDIDAMLASWDVVKEIPEDTLKMQYLESLQQEQLSTAVQDTYEYMHMGRTASRLRFLNGLRQMILASSNWWYGLADEQFHHGPLDFLKMDGSMRPPQTPVMIRMMMPPQALWGKLERWTPFPSRTNGFMIDTDLFKSGISFLTIDDLVFEQTHSASIDARPTYQDAIDMMRQQDGMRLELADIKSKLRTCHRSERPGLERQARVITADIGVLVMLVVPMEPLPHDNNASCIKHMVFHMRRDAQLRKDEIKEIPGIYSEWQPPMCDLCDSYNMLPLRNSDPLIECSTEGCTERKPSFCSRKCFDEHLLTSVAHIGSRVLRRNTAKVADEESKSESKSEDEFVREYEFVRCDASCCRGE